MKKKKLVEYTVLATRTGSPYGHGSSSKNRDRPVVPVPRIGIG